MKQFIFSIFAFVGMLALISCERHEWEDSDGKKNGTKNLYPQHDKEDHGKGGHDHNDQDGHKH